MGQPIRWTPTEEYPAMCEQCGLTYAVKPYGDPKTIYAFTCDDCGGAVEVEDLSEMNP